MRSGFGGQVTIGEEALSLLLPDGSVFLACGVLVVCGAYRNVLEEAGSCIRKGGEKK